MENNKMNNIQIIETKIPKTDIQNYTPANVEFYGANKLSIDIAPEYVNELTANGYTVFVSVGWGDYASRDGVHFDHIQFL